MRSTVDLIEKIGLFYRQTVHNGVNLEMLAVLMSLGFEENICKRGLIATGNRAADEAISWCAKALFKSAGLQSRPFGAKIPFQRLT